MNERLSEAEGKFEGVGSEGERWVEVRVVRFTSWGVREVRECGGPANPSWSGEKGVRG
jgi:hypothetical protein